jgi:hypothetical protein
LGSADSRLATMQPAVPAPTTIKSKSPSSRFGIFQVSTRKIMTVMPGFMPGIHVFLRFLFSQT